MASELINKYKSYDKTKVFSLAIVLSAIVGMVVPSIIAAVFTTGTLIGIVAAIGTMVLPIILMGLSILAVTMGYLIKAHKDIKAGNGALYDAYMPYAHNHAMDIDAAHLHQNQDLNQYNNQFLAQFEENHAPNEEEEKKQQRLIQEWEDELSEEPKNELLTKFAELEEKYGIDDNAIKIDPKYEKDQYDFFGPMSRVLFENPVLAADGGTYEYLWIYSWITKKMDENSDDSWNSPLGLGDKCYSNKLTPNTELLKKMEVWVDYKLAQCKEDAAQNDNNDQDTNPNDPLFPGTGFTIG